MIKRYLYIFLVTILLSLGGYGADSEVYGFQPGTVVGFVGGGGTYASGLTGIHPTVGGGVEVGFHRYLGIFGEGGYSSILNETVGGCYYAYCSSVTANASVIQFGAGLEVVGSNHSRFVPYGKVGMGYVRGQGGASSSGYSYSASAGAAAIVFGGGVRGYINRHFGIDTQITGLRTVGNYGGGTTGVLTFGVFVQSK